jgi:hypothetical protein
MSFVRDQLVVHENKIKLNGVENSIRSNRLELSKKACSNKYIEISRKPQQEPLLDRTNLSFRSDKRLIKKEFYREKRLKIEDPHKYRSYLKIAPKIESLLSDSSTSSFKSLLNQKTKVFCNSCPQSPIFTELNSVFSNSSEILPTSKCDLPTSPSSPLTSPASMLIKFHEGQYTHIQNPLVLQNNMKKEGYDMNMYNSLFYYYKIINSKSYSMYLNQSDVNDCDEFRIEQYICNSFYLTGICKIFRVKILEKSDQSSVDSSTQLSLPRIPIHRIKYTFTAFFQ